jgi:UDP-N-acetylmuramoyl-tripeptide--D-alanyl-D-alanine ligase
MRALRLSELQGPLEATLHGEDLTIEAITTDSRALNERDLFVALKGENFDGHDYLDQVASSGAVAALVSQEIQAGLPSLKVDDTQRALGLLGAYNRSLYTGTLVAITGSNGKTTAKNMIHAVLSRAGKTLATQANFNNEIGVPLTLLRLHPGIEFAVVEMGAAKGGDIAWLCELGRPSVAVLLNAMPAHLKGFGSLEEVAAAKGEIFDGLGADDCAVINADAPWAKQWRRRAGAARVIDFGLEQPAAITARDINPRGFEGVNFTVSSPAGEIAVRLALPGVHNVANALAATAVGLACGMALTDIRDGLESSESVAGRLRVERADGGAKLIDDSYNANPGSVKAAIDTLAECEGRRILVLGAMGELGSESEALHKQVGEQARTAGLDVLIGVGPELEPTVAAFGKQAQYFTSREDAAKSLVHSFGPQDIVLIKGSRSSGMELVLEALRDGSRSGRAQPC